MRYLLHNIYIIKRLFVLMVVLPSLLLSCTLNLIDDSSIPEIDGFEEPVTETTEEYRVTYQYNDDVIVLIEELQQYLIKVEADTILYFSSKTPDSFMPEKGDVITARVSEKLPYGLGNVVLEVSEVEGMTKCVTTHTGLDEIYAELSWEFNASMMDSLLDGYEDENGNFVKPEYVWYDIETGEFGKDITKGTVGRLRLLELPYEFYLPKDKKPEGDTENINGFGIDGAVYVGAFVHCSGDVRDGNFDFYFEPIIGTDAEVKIGVKHMTKDKWPIFKFKDILKAVIQVGPLTLRPYVDIESFIETEASGTISLEAGKVFAFKVGYSQAKEAYIENTTANRDNGNFIKSVNWLNGKVEASYKCMFDVGCGLYTKKVAIEIDPFLEYSLGTELTLSNEIEEGTLVKPESNSYFDINVGAVGKMVIDWFGCLKYAPEMTFVDTNILHLEYPLIPDIEEDSFIVEEQTGGKSPVYDVAYNIHGGLLSTFCDIYPGIAVYKDSVLLYKKLFTDKTEWNESVSTSFTLDDLENSNMYKARAFARIWSYDLELEERSFPDIWVDLGLPSGILWAAYNVGATSPEEYGGYYAWGETEEKEIYVEDNYDYYNPSTYVWTFIGTDIRSTSYDVAHVVWGNGARMPSIDEFDELANNCTIKCGTYNNVKGDYIIGPNGNTIFLPFAGYKMYDFLRYEGSAGTLWAGSYDAFFRSDAVILWYEEDYCGSDGEPREYGRTVRPVKDPTPGSKE